jgi:type VI secretion system secreted protein VgrG
VAQFVGEEIMSAGTYTQTNRPLQIATPLGRDAVWLVGFEGQESISGPYRFRLSLLAANNRPVAFDKLLGQKVTVGLALGEGGVRHFSGIISRFAQGARDKFFTAYEAELVPQFWLLTHRVQSRIFQHQTVPEILKEVLRGLDVTYQIQGTFAPRDYCVQYRESDFAFASRLMEEEGIYYFFKHADGRHEMVLANTPQSHPDLPGPCDLIYDEVEGGTRPEFRITGWKKEQELRSGKVTLWDHCFELPHKHLEASRPVLDAVPVGTVKHKLQVGGNDQLEIYDYPGGYAQRFDGIDRGGGERPAELQKIYEDNRRTAAIRAQQVAAQALTIRGASTCGQFASGHRFTLTRHFDADGPYVVTAVEHSAHLSGNYRSGDGVVLAYENRFRCIPLALPYRPPLVTPRPRIDGTQTAVVVGPPGPEQIYTDKYGRVKVKFHWDRSTSKPEESSCWIRVGTPWAGKGYGMIHIPRRGHEVIVAFEEGDPDRPIIVGSVYNAETMPPFPLPACKKQSGMVSASNKPTGGFNQISINDSHGKEQISIHGQYDMSTVVENNESHSAKNRGTIVAEVDNLLVGTDYLINVGSNNAIKVGAAYSVEAKTITLKASDQITLVCGGSSITLVPGAIAIKSNGPVSINGKPVYINC